MTTGREIDPWERQPGETDKAFSVFVTYRDAGPSRSLRKTASALGRELTQLADWSVRWGWQVRVRAWDDEMDRVRRQAALAETEAMAVRHARQARAAQDAAMAPVRAVLERMRSDPGWVEELEKLPLADAVGLALTAARQLPPLQVSERLARGEPTEITSVEVSVGPSSREDLGRVVEALGRVGLAAVTFGDEDGESTRLDEPDGPDDR